MLSPKHLLLSSTRYLASYSEPLAALSLTMLQNLRSRFFYPGAVEHGGTYAAAPPSSRDFNVTTCAVWFDGLCHGDDGVMTSSDILTFCDTIAKDPSDIVFLILSYKMGVKMCGRISQFEWISGMGHFEIDSNRKLVERWESIRSLLNEDADLERSVFRFSYDYVRDRDQDGNRIDVESGMELVRIFLEKKWKYCQAFLRFLTLTKVKALTRDQFLNIIDFSRDVLTLEGYDDSGAWPILLDEFVSHVQGHGALYSSALGPSVPSFKGPRLNAI